MNAPIRLQNAPTTVVDALAWALARLERCNQDEGEYFVAAKRVLDEELAMFAGMKADIAKLEIGEDFPTLRDSFAGQAMQGFCADPSNHVLFDDHDDVAQNAYKLADAMLAARSAS